MITPEQLEAVDTQVKEAMVSAPLDEAVVGQLREAFPGVHFTWCMDDDVSDRAKPVREAGGYNIYLVDAREHCMTLTSDAEAATGLVIAEVEDD